MRPRSISIRDSDAAAGESAANTQFTKRLFSNLTYRYGQKIRYIEDPYQGRGSDASAIVTYLPSEKAPPGPEPLILGLFP